MQGASFRAAVFTGLLLTLAGGTASADGLGAPAVACDYLDTQGLKARDGYRQTGSAYACHSQRKVLIGGGLVNNSIRFVARGDQDRVTSLRLELIVNSREAVQRAHRSLVEHADSLMQAALQRGLPGEIESAILAATAGEWTDAGRRITLKKIVSGAPVYELRFTIE
ncbi:MAG: hypothetical protein H6953_10350 [Chromatiaceae bacterium]|nr:hypothetical protein [Chromatiaceae bacterium]MCP5312695.1 hypothetical protein [Chromatiaceae bacterium]